MSAVYPDDVQRLSNAAASEYLNGDDEGRALHVIIAEVIQAERKRAANIAFDVMFSVTGAPMARALQLRILSEAGEAA